MRSKWIVRNSSSKISNHSKSMLKSFYLLPTCISHCIELQYKPIWPIDTICRKNPNLFSNCMIGSCFPFIVDRYAVFMLTKCFAQWKLLSQALMFLMPVSFYVCLKKSCSAAFATALNEFSRTFCHTFNFINSSVLYLSRCFFVVAVGWHLFIFPIMLRHCTVVDLCVLLSECVCIVHSGKTKRMIIWQKIFYREVRFQFEIVPCVFFFKMVFNMLYIRCSHTQMRWQEVFAHNNNRASNAYIYTKKSASKAMTRKYVRRATRRMVWKNETNRYWIVYGGYGILSM